MKSVFVAICGVLVIAVTAAVGVGKLGPEDKEMKSTLSSNVWIGSRIEMPGFSGFAEDVLGSDIRLTFEKNGKCSLVIQGEALEAKWKLKGNEIRIQGKGIDTKGDFEDSNPLLSEFPPMLTLYNIENYMIIFYSEAYLSSAGEGG